VRVTTDLDCIRGKGKLIIQSTDNDETFQFYSTFTSTYKPPQEYESLLVSASKLRSRAVESYQRKEIRELALVCLHSLFYFSKLRLDVVSSSFLFGSIRLLHKRRKETEKTRCFCIGWAVRARHCCSRKSEVCWGYEC
jgi:hypothetical protein